jgi:gluconate 2-dehydrogenase gamma chain
MDPALRPFEWLLADARALSRRKLIAWASALPWVSSCRSQRKADESSEAGPEAGARPTSGGLFHSREWRTIDALASRILPSDDGPGAREAGVVGFIDRQLSSGPLAPLGSIMIELAKRIELHAEKIHGRSYADLPQADQDAILAKLSRAELSLSLPERQLYEALHTLTLEGFLSDPHHGGNLDQVGWKYVHFAEPTLREPGQPHRHGSLPTVR